MNDVAARDSTTGPASPGPQAREGAASRGRGCLRTIGTLGLIFGVLVVLGFVWLLVSLRSAFPPMQAVPAPVAWTSREIVLSPDRPVVRGRLTLTASTAAKGGLRVGLNAGVPSTEAQSPQGSGATTPAENPDPAALLSGPLVRLTATTASGAPQSCLAPCELELQSSLRCESGACRIDFVVTVELLAGSAGRGAVTIGVAGGATAPLDKELPDGLAVDLALEGAIAPGSS